MKPRVVVGGRRYMIIAAREQPESWPRRAVVCVRPVDNVWSAYDDDQSPDAVQATLECGHVLHLTGEDVGLAEVGCWHCLLEALGQRKRGKP